MSHVFVVCGSIEMTTEYKRESYDLGRLITGRYIKSLSEREASRIHFRRKHTPPLILTDETRCWISNHLLGELFKYLCQPLINNIQDAKNGSATNCNWPLKMRKGLHEPNIHAKRVKKNPKNFILLKGNFYEYFHLNYIQNYKNDILILWNSVAQVHKV